MRRKSRRHRRHSYLPNPLQTKTLLYAASGVVAVGLIGYGIYYVMKPKALTTKAGATGGGGGGGGYTPYTAVPHTDPLSALNTYASAYGQGGVQGAQGLITATQQGGDGGATFEQP